MSTISHSLRSIQARHLQLIERAESQEGPEDDGLGCVRGLAVVMLCNLIFAMMIAAGWGLWRLLR